MKIEDLVGKRKQLREDSPLKGCGYASMEFCTDEFKIIKLADEKHLVGLLGKVAPDLVPVLETIEGIGPKRSYVAWVSATMRALTLRGVELDWFLEYTLAGKDDLGGMKVDGDDPDAAAERKRQKAIAPIIMVMTKKNVPVEQVVKMLVVGLGEKKDKDEWKDEKVVTAKVVGFIASCDEGRSDWTVVRDGSKVTLVEKTQFGGLDE